MKRILVPVLMLVALAAVACGGNDKKPAPTQAPAPTATAAPSGKAATQSASGGAEQAVGSIFDTIFSSGALSGGDAGSALSGGDASLEQYLLTKNDVPGGYTPLGEFTYRLPDGASKDGGMDMAASMFASGDLAAADPTGTTMLMSMVLKPDNPTEFKNSFSQAQDLSEQDLRDAIGQGADAFGGIKITDVHLLDASGLGDGGFGMSMTMDMSELIGSMAGSTGDTGSGVDPAKLGKMTMRLYMFGQGDYAAGIIRVGFSESLPTNVDERALAEIIDHRLAAAQ